MGEFEVSNKNENSIRKTQETLGSESNITFMQKETLDAILSKEFSEKTKNQKLHELALNCIQAHKKGLCNLLMCDSCGLHRLSKQIRGVGV